MCAWNIYWMENFPTILLTHREWERERETQHAYFEWRIKTEKEEEEGKKPISILKFVINWFGFSISIQE